MLLLILDTESALQAAHSLMEPSLDQAQQYLDPYLQFLLSSVRRRPLRELAVSPQQSTRGGVE